MFEFWYALCVFLVSFVRSLLDAHAVETFEPIRGEGCREG